MKKKYGVYGMMEWVALLPVGAGTVRVPFAGGSLSGYGSTPATFVTDNAALQRIIETSDYFRRGRIRPLPA